MRIFLTHVPDMLENYYGPRALAEMRKLGEVRTNTSGKVLDAKALAEAASGCEIIVSDRQTPGPAEFFPLAPDCCAFLRVAVDIRNIDVDAASAQGVLVTRATPGFMASVSEMAVGMMIDCGRKIVVVGRSMRRNMNVARNLGYVTVPEDALVKPADLDEIPLHQQLILCTGSQGEPLSALTRIAYNDHPAIKVERGDTVIISARPVPGNELRVHDAINRLTRNGA